MKLTILGCGSSGGVPMATGKPGGEWGQCDPSNPRNRRRRVSILVEEGGTKVLVDASPDLREQIITFGIPRIDAVIFTHDHADHCHGLDDLRGLFRSTGVAIDAYMDQRTLAALQRRFPYAFATSRDPESFYPALMADRLIDGPFSVGPIKIVPFEQNHGAETSLGLRLGPIAYSTDVKELNEHAFEVLQGVSVWVVDCLRDQPHATHSHTAQTLEWIARVKPRRAILTHLNHEIDYEDLRRRCPPGVEPGYDGLTLEV